MVKTWWKEMCVYQIWPRSFYDGNGDGIGDLKGVYEKLEYIKELGADAIWFSPLYTSPKKDYGYDISDYKAIDPDYGTMEDFKNVLEKAHGLGMRIIMDLVINHTSNMHKWFLESRKGGEDNPYKDYYIWRKGRGKDGRKPPNNWSSTFPGEGWEFDEVRKEYYLHLFAVEQPDLNMDNPKVREEVKDIMRFWLSMGVDGFREDVITFISKKEGLPNGFPIPAARGMEHYANGPRIHEFLQEFRTVLDEFGAVSIGEAPMMNPKRALKYIAGDKRDLDMMFHFQHMEADGLFISWFRLPFSLTKLKKVWNKWQCGLHQKAWNTLFLENHDQPRIINRYGFEDMRLESGKALAIAYFLQQGTPFIYQGQEIGMTNYPFKSFDDFVDVNTFAFRDMLKKMGFSQKNILKKAQYSARDNARTPVQWSGAENAGFTVGTPWFSVNPNYPSVNIEQSMSDENGLWHFYRRLISLRKDNAVFIYGDFRMYYKKDKQLIVYERNYEGEKAFVIVNLSKKPASFKNPWQDQLETASLAVSTHGENGFDTLKPYEARVYLK